MADVSIPHAASETDIIDQLAAENARLRGALEDVDNVCGEWRRTLDSGRAIDRAGVHGLRLHVQTALGWRTPVRDTQ